MTTQQSVLDDPVEPTTAGTTTPAVPPDSSRAEARRLGLLLLALGAGLLGVAALGPLGFGVIQYRYSTSMVNQAIGLDAFAVVVVVPVALSAAWLVFRGRPGGPLLTLPPGAFALYMLTQYVIGPEYLLLDGNNERFFLVFVALFIVAGVTLSIAWRMAGTPAWSAAQHRRRGRTLLVLAAFVVAGMYMSNGFLSAMSDFPAFVSERAATTEYDEHPTAYWLVATLDLAVVVPLTAATGIALLRRRKWARRAFYAVIGWFALVPGSVAAMAIVMVAKDDPAASAPKAVGFSVAAVVFFVLAGRTFFPVVARRGFTAS